ncbi:MAG: Adhesin for cattle intestine colonization [Candidatus Woesebacteria bacterium GW2011_GWA2_40_7]|uniref:Adhesin for cattle intestine colonization n=3 Tax=Candidatus Woeseibacteriota TaxID=1752722 RepID=A0A0G0LM78_9BACT|nr:MAG: Adhesin for cattle intestine colonization [Candidatus Woesebacteria bacterium GW2011_GWB1_39_10]KKR73246.1 MAG: Adhesin for cattle intestine colonization [Candidatus Woesebacteria bacterium GW2011_GWA2_40_7]KKS91077.1 MAG: Adhesin for cattle intestine colonization [Candidatus Woesebacteria bacterium GW2011_GWA1_43_12]
MIKKNKIPTILGIIILLAGIFAGVFFLGMNQVFKIGADSSIAPKDIRISNIDNSSATISWITDKETFSFVSWGEGQTSLNKIEREGNEKLSIHTISLTGLKPGTKYFYKINSGGTMFDNKGIPWQFSTGPDLGINQKGFLISGSVINASGEPEREVLVYINIDGYLLSTLTSNTGNFVFQLGSVRTQDLADYAQIDKAQTLLQISVQAGDHGVASAQIFPQSANPVPPMVLGQVYDLRSLQPSESGQIPTANLSLPEDATKESKFFIPIATGSPTPTSVILESLNEGEIVTNSRPEFFGRGPGGEKITITIQSDPISQDMFIASDGTWTFSAPVDLGAGAHSITISWIDSNGITRTLTRNFIVQASENPAFTASDSGIFPSPSASPGATPTTTPTASPKPIPVTGETAPTLILFAIGVAIMIFGTFIWKMSEN